MKVRDIIRRKINEIFKSKIKLIGVCSLFVVLITVLISVFKFTYAIPENSNYNLFFPVISKHTEPTELLVMVFLYDDYTNHDEQIDYVFNMTDEEIQSKYYKEIFGTGSTDDQTWSINDYYKENSSGKFYFKPVLIGDNESGIYPIRFNKTYNMDNFSSDIKEGFKTLTDEGFIPEGFGMQYNGTDKKKILCIFPKIKIEHFGGYLLTDNLVADMAITSFSSVLSVTTHELGHALGLPDLYYQGSQATLMGEITIRSDIPDIRYPGTPFNYNIIPHMDPLHKIALGWEDYEIIDKNMTVKLYPTTSSLYNPIIIPTENDNQYYIIENRQATSFESQINKYYENDDIEDPEDAGFSSYEGINIWRIDKLGYNIIQSSIPRKGDYVIGNLKYENETFFPKKYISKDDSSSNLKENTNIKITYVKSNLDGSVDIDINFDDKYKNSYIVRYNANDGTNNYIDKTYSYTQKVDFSDDLFTKTGYKLVEWNTMQDGSGTGYKPNYYNEVYGLTDIDSDVVNLYAQWGKENIVKFNLNGANGTMEDVIAVSGMYTLPECNLEHLNKDYIFKGWMYEGKLYVPGEQVYVDKDIELTAQWRDKNINVIKFNLSGVIGSMEDVTVNTGMFILPECDEKNLNSNLEFKGWMFEGKLYVPGEQIYVDKDITLFARWETKNSFKVSFESNNGSPIETQIVERGGTIKEPSNLIKDGYTFGGWYEDSDYKIKFYFGQLIYSDLTLYAKWIPNENIIKSIDLKMEIPTVGDKVTIEKEKFEDMEFWNWNSQKPQMKITISDEEHYHLADEDGAYNYMHWITKDSYENILDPFNEEPFVGTFEYNTTYYARIFLETDKDYLFDNDVLVTVNGKNTAKIVYVNEDYIDLAVEITTYEAKEDLGKYTILDGANQNYFIDTGKDLTIKVDGDISDFEDIKVDDVTVDKENYTITSGSTIVTLKQSYLNTLLEGTHKISFVYKDGEVSTTFTINNSKNNDTSDDVRIQENSTTTKPAAIDDNEESNSSPATGDNIILWIIISIIAVVGAIVTYKNIKKNNSKY